MIWLNQPNIAGSYYVTLPASAWEDGQQVYTFINVEGKDHPTQTFPFPVGLIYGNFSIPYFSSIYTTGDMYMWHFSMYKPQIPAELSIGIPTCRLRIGMDTNVFTEAPTERRHYVAKIVFTYPTSPIRAKVIQTQMGGDTCDIWVNDVEHSITFDNWISSEGINQAEILLCDTCV